MVFKPLRLIFRFIFYRVIVKFYCWYRPLAKKFLRPVIKERPLGFVYHQKIAHFFVLFISVILIFINLTAKTEAGGMTDKVQNTILYDLIKSEDGQFAEDDQYVVETFDQEVVISPLQQVYLENLSGVRTQPRVLLDEEEGEYADEQLPAVQDGTALVKPDISETRIAKRPRTEPLPYTVAAGDSVSTIAEEFGISVSTILWENNLSAYSIIRPGDKLTILPASGLTHSVIKNETLGTIAKKYDVKEEDITGANKLGNETVLAVGQKIFIPGGKKINYPVYNPKPYTGLSALKDIVNLPNAKPQPGNKMNWPTEGSRITQYYSWRHTALDVANKKGTPIYAADAGTVEVLGWGTGYGNQIVIDHGGGKKTRYSHLSAFKVKKGQSVSKGQAIGAMGSTGWSTGSHLHFEVIINNVKYNPLNYLR